MMKSNSLSSSARLSMAAALILTLVFALPAAAITITGVVTNGTTHKPAAGDTVVLISLAQKMQEVAHTKTDSRGRYSISGSDSGMHLIRVDHQKAAYFQPVPPDASNVNVEIYDVAAAVSGLTTEADVLRVQTDSEGLSVTRSLFVKNASEPPRTQFSRRSFDFYLPDNAVLTTSAAMGPGGMPVQSSPVPVAGQKGLYSFLFPVRPGETQFQLGYHLPYSGKLTFSPRLASAVDNFVVMLPKSMTFEPGASSSFQSLGAEAGQPAGTQTYLIRNVDPSRPPVFTVSGSGTIPADNAGNAGAASDAGSGPEGAPAQNSASVDDRPGIGLGKPIDTPDPLHKYRWWLLGGIGLIFAAGAGFLLRKPVQPESAALPAGANPPKPSVPVSGQSLLQALKDELFVLEADRLQGKVSDSEYGEVKSALELVLRRALARQPAHV